MSRDCCPLASASAPWASASRLSAGQDTWGLGIISERRPRASKGLVPNRVPAHVAVGPDALGTMALGPKMAPHRDAHIFSFLPVFSLQHHQAQVTKRPPGAHSSLTLVLSPKPFPELLPPSLSLWQHRHQAQLAKPCTPGKNGLQLATGGRQSPAGAAVDWRPLLHLGQLSAALDHCSTPPPPLISLQGLASSSRSRMEAARRAQL